MKKILLLFFSNFCFWTINAQYSFISDLNYKPRDISSYDSTFHIDMNFDFQLRVWTAGNLPPTHSLFILTSNRDSLSIRYFRLQKNDSIGNVDWREINIANADIANYWAYIDSKNIRKLPSMKKIFKKHHIEEIRSYDGPSYWIELLSKNGSRGSRYYCPKSNSRNYPKAVEFKWVTDIIEATYNLVNERWSLCMTTANIRFSAMLADE